MVGRGGGVGGGRWMGEESERDGWKGGRWRWREVEMEGGGREEGGDGRREQENGVCSRSP